jgi:hypothetical protein
MEVGGKQNIKTKIMKIKGGPLWRWKEMRKGGRKKKDKRVIGWE